VSEPTPAPPSAAEPEKKVPVYKNPFVIGFLVGIAFLTALPFMQRPFLKAPPPIGTVAPWHLPTVDGGVIGSADLKGTVWLASFPPPTCIAMCPEKQQGFGRTLNHVDDFDGGIAIVTFAFDTTHFTPPAELRPGRWYVTRGTEAELDAALASFRAGFAQFAHRDGGATAVDFSDTPAIALVDQDGALRGFWMDDAPGRGNAINAARLLARYGPTP